MGSFRLVSALLILLAAAVDALAHGTIRFDNGRWWNGSEFVSVTMYSADGVFRESFQGKADATTDLRGKFILPPFADAHNHIFADGMNFQPQLQDVLWSGIFYVKNPNNTVRFTREIRAQGNRPETVDVAYSNGGLTAPGGHPVQIYDIVAKKLGAKPEEMRDQAYFIVASERDLDEKWPLIRAGKPDFLKTYLEHSEEFDQRKDAPAYFGRRGLDPKLLARIVRRAHADGLRVSTHISSRVDFRNAVAAGVDEINHLPLELLTEADATEAAKHGVTIVTTTISHRPVGEIQDTDALHRSNLRVLRAAGALIVFGTDHSERSVLDEVDNLRRLGVFTDRELLQILTDDTARAIFPSRKIGRLSDGYEASFIALEGNPLEDFSNVRKVAVRVKQGHELRLQPPAPKKPSIADAIGHTILQEGSQAGIAEYRRLRAEQPEAYDFSEAQLNGLGYTLLKHGKIDDAIAILQLNVEVFPNAFNVYDSLGEAFMVAGKRDQAIANYRKSLELNPHSENGKKMLDKLLAAE